MGTRGPKTRSFFCHRCQRTVEGSWKRHERRRHKPKKARRK